MCSCECLALVDQPRRAQAGLADVVHVLLVVRCCFTAVLALLSETILYLRGFALLVISVDSLEVSRHRRFPGDVEADVAPGTDAWCLRDAPMEGLFSL